MEFNTDFTIPKLIKKTVSTYPEIIAQYKRIKNGEFEPITYREMFQLSLDFGSALLDVGIKRGDFIGLISDNRAEWQQADIGLLSIGAVDVPRGCDATIKDLQYILSFAGCETVIAENSSQIKKILSIKTELPDLKQIIYFSEPVQAEKDTAAADSVALYAFTDILTKGKMYRAMHEGAVEAELEKAQRDDVVGIIFTSGTTGI